MANEVLCNPPGRGLGPLPTTSTGYPNVDAFAGRATPASPQEPAFRAHHPPARSGERMRSGLSATLTSEFGEVAYVQRDGPGTTCWRTATSSGCDQHLNPIPWLVVGLVLVAAVLAQTRHADSDRWRRRSDRTSP
jgi:hypothetical protein